MHSVFPVKSGVTPVHVPSIWSIKIPPGVHFFLWLLTNNKLLTRGNLTKRLEVVDKSCLFCKDCESTHHLFFECVVAKRFGATSLTHSIEIRW
jgi:hypothetical protein